VQESDTLSREIRARENDVGKTDDNVGENDGMADPATAQRRAMLALIIVSFPAGPIKTILSLVPEVPFNSIRSFNTL